MEVPKFNAKESTVLKYAKWKYGNNEKKITSFMRGWFSVKAPK